MSKHDTWVFLKTDSPYKNILDLFPQGIPMRDPFPLERAEGNFEGIALWIVDLDRLSSSQAVELTKLIAAHCNVTPIAVYEEVVTKGGFAIRTEWVERMNCGPEGMQRTRELADFLESAPQPPSAEAFMEFYEDQHRRWIEGSEKPEPLPERIEDWDQRLRTPELEAALQLQQINKMLTGYSVFDVLTGRAMVDVLNQLDPEHNYELVGWDEVLDDE